MSIQGARHIISPARKRAAILFADIIGHTSLMHRDEDHAFILLRRFHEKMEEEVAEHHGRIINFYGDGALCIFQNSLDAMLCAMAVQASFEESPHIPVRIGVHSGSVVFYGDFVYGDSVNITSRIESLGVDRAVLCSGNIKRDLINHPEIETVSLGNFDFKNVVESMEVFALANNGFTVPKRNEMNGKLKLPNRKSVHFVRWLLLMAIIAIVGLACWQFQN